MPSWVYKSEKLKKQESDDINRCREALLKYFKRDRTEIEKDILRRIEARVRKIRSIEEHVNVPSSVEWLIKEYFSE